MLAMIINLVNSFESNLLSAPSQSVVDIIELYIYIVHCNFHTTLKHILL